MTTLIAFLITLGVLVVVHEYGHYLAARLCGVKVLRFAVGFGRPLYIRRFGNDSTELVVAAFPLGGYVKMLDEREGPVAEEEKARAFNRQPVGKRIAIVAAGPIANLLLAIMLYWVLLMSGVTGVRPLLGDIAADSPAGRAGMKAEELVVRVGSTAVQTWQEVRWALLQELLGNGSLEIEAKSGKMETHLHRLDLSQVKLDDEKHDILEQLGLEGYRPVWPALVGEVIAGGAADRGGLQVGDEVLAVNGAPIASWEDFASQIRRHPEQTVTVEIRRGADEMLLKLTPEVSTDNTEKVGRVGAAYRMTQADRERYLVEVRYPPLQALWLATARTWDMALFSLRSLGGMITGSVSLKSMGGPLTIGSAAGQSASAGWQAFLTFLALVSISLGVLNLLPVPVLDGGHLMYYMVEILKGGPVSERAMEIGSKVGLAIIGLLMAIAFYNDINRFITG